LKEEKERGITIDIGFAYWRDHITIIDVPGHEKFIRNMVAGVSTIDFFLLVIAADDGIMPQTIEHLDILNFFNIHDGIVVLNKIDLVDPQWLEMVQQEVLALLKRYNLQDLPVIPVSALKNLNLDRLKQAIEYKINSAGQIHSRSPFRLLIDRSFQIKGFGTVVTGTVLSGVLSKGEEVEVYPVGKKVKVRGLQIHTRDTEQVKIGHRAAVNLSDLSSNEVFRGDVLAAPGSMMPVNEFTGMMRTVSFLPSQIKNRSRVHVYTGTAERAGNIYWYDPHRYLQSNHAYHVRLKLDTPATAAPADVFLIRLHSPVLTIAGGKILEINPAYLPATGNWSEYFTVMSGTDLTAQIERIIQNQAFKTVSTQFLQTKLFAAEEVIKESIDKLVAAQKIIKIVIKGSEHWVHVSHFNFLKAEILDQIKQFHQQHPLKAGVNLQELRSRTGKKWLPEEIYTAVLQHLLNGNLIRQDQNFYYLAGFTIQLDQDFDQAGHRLLEVLSISKFSPPDIAELSGRLQMPVEEVRVLLNSLLKQKKLASISHNLFLHQAVHEQLIEFLRNYFSTHSQMPVAVLKDFIRTTRKYAIPILEYLDANGFTVRSGDRRKKGPNL
jgi:selenocysteine-specific elongation factor